MKKAFVFGLVLILCLSSIAYAVTFPDLSQYSTSDLQTIRTAIDKELLSRSAASNGNASSGKLGNYNVSILDGTVVKDTKGASYLVVTFEWSHTEKEAQSFWLAFMYRAYQDGVEIDSAFLNGLEHNTYDTKIKAGAVLKTQIGFKLSNTTSPVEVEIENSWDWNSKDKVTRTFVIK
jgi:hypothetical protein